MSPANPCRHCSMVDVTILVKWVVASLRFRAGRVVSTLNSFCNDDNSKYKQPFMQERQLPTRAQKHYEILITVGQE